MPKWATQERRGHLVRLFLKSGGFCVFGERPCACPQAHHYEPFIEGVIRDWVLDDRAEAEALWRMERGRMHQIPDGRFRQGTFDTLRRELFLASRPAYYIEALGMDAIRLKMVAKVRIPSTEIRLFVDVSSAVKVSRKRRRKRFRYWRPTKVHKEIRKLVEKAVADWHKQHS